MLDKKNYQIYIIRKRKVIIDIDLIKKNNYFIDIYKFRKYLENNINLFPENSYFKLTRIEYYNLLLTKDKNIQLKHLTNKKEYPYVLSVKYINIIINKIKNSK